MVWLGGVSRYGAVCIYILFGVILCNGDVCSKSEITAQRCTNESVAEARDFGHDSPDFVWSHFLEDYVLSQGQSESSHRQSKDLPYMGDMMGPNQGPINYHSSAYKRPPVYINKRIGEAVELEPHMRPPIKVVNPQFRPMTNPVQHQQPPQQQPGFLQQLFGIGGGGGGGQPSGPSGQASSLHQQQQQQHQQLQLQQQQHLRPQQAPQHGAAPQTFRAVSENDLYLLGAIEKLVYRVDYLESRIRRAEQLIYYLMAGNNQKEVRDPCPSNFTRISDNCYYINSFQKVNWKTANTACKGVNAHLVEFERSSENEEIMAYLLNQPTHRGRDFWLGALNPGLLWIWSNSAKPVNPNMNLTSIAMSHDSNGPSVETNLTEDTDKTPGDEGDHKKDKTDSILNNTAEIKGQGRCLRLTYNPSKNSYAYYGQECTSKHHYICEYEDKTLDNKIKKISRDLKLFD